MRNCLEHWSWTLINLGKRLTLSLPKANSTKPRKHLNPTKSENVATQMKALDEYFLMVVFTFLLMTADDKVHVF